MCENGVRGFSFVALMLLFVMQSAMAMDSSAKSKVTIPYKDGANIWVKSSADHPVTFLELYSSQGCYSCPPAERWINTFVDDNRLWDTLIPVNFHVDYWDYIGWKDPFSFAEFSSRQRLYRQKGHTSNVATPGFVVNGQGWNGWFRQRSLPVAARAFEGELQASFSKEGERFPIDIAFDSDASLSRVNVHAAVLGFGVATPIPSGENAGKTLEHDFVVVGYRRGPMDSNAGSAWRKSLVWPEIVEQPMERQALVVWVTAMNDPKPIQVLGGWLPD